MNAAVAVRTVRGGDGPAMAAVWRNAAAYYAELDPQRFQVPEGAKLMEGLDRPPTGDALRLVGTLDGHLVGWATARLERPLPSAAAQMVPELAWTRLCVDALVVQPGAWRHGAGGALLAAAEDWGRARGAVLARLDTYADSPVSVPFYERRMGYRRRAIVFEKPLA